MEQLNAIWDQAQAYWAQLVADESGRLAVAIVATGFFALVIGILIGRPSRSSRPAPAPERRESEPVLDADRAVEVAPDMRRTGSATAVYRSMLETRGVPADDINGLVRQFAEQVDGFRAAMDKLAGDDAELKTRIEEARRALDSGAFEAAVKAVDAVASSHAEVARNVRQQERERFALSAAAMEFIGDLHVALDDFEAAARWYRLAVETMPERPASGLVGCLNKHATSAYRGGDYIAATSSFDRVRKILEKSLGVDHPDVATALNNQALMYYEQGNYTAAEPLYKRALMIDEKTLGPHHPDVATDLNNLALLYMNQGDFKAAEPAFNRSVAIKERNHELGHPSLVTGLRNYAALLRSMGRPEEARTLEARSQARATVPGRPAALS